MFPFFGSFFLLAVKIKGPISNNKTMENPNPRVDLSLTTESQQLVTTHCPYFYRQMSGIKPIHLDIIIIIIIIAPLKRHWAAVRKCS